MKPIIQIAGLLCLFVLSQLIASLFALFLFNIPLLVSEGIFDVNLLSTSASALGCSMLLTFGIVIAGMFPLQSINLKDFSVTGIPGSIYGYTALLMLPAIFLINLFSEWLSLEDINHEAFEMLMYNPLGIIAIVLTGPLTEELVFRMGIQTGFKKMGLSPSAAIILSSLLFGLIHINPAQIPGAIAFGLILGWLYQRSGNILLPTAAHVLNNLISVALVWATGNTDQTIADLCGGTWQTATFSILSILLLIWSFRTLQNRLCHQP